MIRLTLLLLLIAAPAQADEMAFYLKNQASAGVAVELTSRDREMQWPGSDKVYFLEPGDKKFIQVECLKGEQICYGAWVEGAAGTNWGIGPERDRQCTNCCVICVEKTTTDVDIGP